jgi:16S rRNA (guanine527-N7)-methyltransferase
MRDYSPALVDALGHAQGIGLLGPRPIPEVLAHADAFVDALDLVEGRIIDLGSGGGVPGLVVADARHDLAVDLVDRRRTRTDVLERLVHRLGWTDRVRVVPIDAEDLARREPGSADAVVSRGFGPPSTTLRVAQALVRPGGLIVISEPPSHLPDRWAAIDLGDVERVQSPAPAVAVFRRLDRST